MDVPAQHAQDRNPSILAPRVAGGGWLESPKQYQQRESVADLKGKIDFEALVKETHDINRSDKVLCPVHEDRTPSCHIYEDHFFCFSCGAGGDAVTWLKHVRKLSTGEAIRNLRERVGGTYLVTPSAPRQAAPKPPPAKTALRPIDGDVLNAHLERAARLKRGPAALSGRGFTVGDLRQLGIAADGDDAVMPMTGPTGDVMALKRRYAKPRGKMRYAYDTKGHGTPAWCSLGFRNAAEALVIEGELNGMAAWLARPGLGVQGVAGTSGDIYADALKDKIVYVYGDGDTVGLEARDRWAGEAVKAGAAHVYVLEPWEMDACDLAGRLGRAELAGRLS